MKFYFITISSLSFFPAFKYILESFLKFNIKQSKYYLIESHVYGFPNYSNTVKTCFYHQFSSMDDFNKMSKFLKIKKYVWVIFFLIKAILNKKTVIYTSDYQVLFIAFKLFRIFKIDTLNIKLIYHQYELIEAEHPKNVLQIISQNLKYIDLVIIPEKYRLNYFIKNTGIDKSKTILFLNSCRVNNAKSPKHPLLHSFKEDDIIIAHIGNIGFNLYIIEFLDFFNNANLPQNYKLLFIGKQSELIKKIILDYQNNKIHFLNEVPHNELSSIYDYIDLGLILYKPLDLNLDYCAPNKLNEYWAHGVPVLAPKLTGLVNIISETMGILVDFNNLDNGILRNINKLNPEKRNSIKNEFKNKFEINIFQKQLENKLNELLA